MTHCTRIHRMLALAAAILLTGTQAASDRSLTAQPPAALWTHELTDEVEFYLIGPQQARPPDGRWPKGTRLRVIRQAGSYWQVRAEDGTEAYVVSQQVRAIDDPNQVLREDVQTLVEGHTRFALDMYRQLASPRTENVVFSPLSIAAALAMTTAGARNQTQRELAEVLHLPWTTHRAHAAFAWLHQQLVSGSAPTNQAAVPASPIQNWDYDLRIANRLFGQQGYRFEMRFLEVTRDYYGAELMPVQFGRPGVAKQINQWVERQTANKIKELVSDEMLDAMTRLVLVNAVYFYGNWASPFDPHATKEAPFYCADGRQEQVPMMYREGNFGYGREGDVQVLEMPYGKSGTMSMIVLLPDRQDGLAKLESTLDPKTIEQWLSRMARRNIELYFPRYRLEMRMLLNKPLQDLGIRQAFDPVRADFSGITTDEQLYISLIIHQTYLDVQEQGTEAAAATGAVVKATAAALEPIVFRADRPFIFLIRHRPTGALIFLGRFGGPK